MTSRPVRGYDPDAPDPAWDVGWDADGDRATDPPAERPLRLGDEPQPGPVPDGVWVDPFDDLDGGEHRAEPFDDMLDDTPTARADRAYGRAIDPATPTDVLRTVLADLASWDVGGLIAEAAVLAGPTDDDVEVTTGDRPEVVVLRSLLHHPNLPDDAAELLLTGWLEDTVERSPWPAVIACALDQTVDADLLVTAVSEACDAARGHDPPAWSFVLVATAAARTDASEVLDLLALVGFPHDDPARVWPDAEGAAKGLPGGARARARTGAEALGWDGRRLPELPATVAQEVHAFDRTKRRSSFADTLELCSHGPVVVTPTGVTLPSHAAGKTPYVALIVGSHPVFRLKRDWPDRADGATGTAWSWSGPRVIETRGLGCDRCRQDRDNDKRYFVTTGDAVADIRVSLIQRVLDAPPPGTDG